MQEREEFGQVDQPLGLGPFLWGKGLALVLAAQQDLQKGAELGFDTAVPSAFIERLKAQR